MIWYIPAIIALGLLIIVHEGGHFIVARLCKMKVERFSLFFGPPILKFQRGDTVYQIGSIPLGGFVQIAGMNPHDEVNENDPHVYPNRPAYQRALTIFAGPGTNYLFASILWLILISIAGAPLPRVNGVEPSMAAAKAGLEPGDTVVAVGGKRITFESFDGFSDMINRSNGKPIDLTVKRPARGFATTLTSVRDPATEQWRLGLSRAKPAIGDQLIKGATGYTQADVQEMIAITRLDLRPGDTIKTANGDSAVWGDYQSFQALLARTQGQSLAVTVARPAAELAVRLTPTWDPKNGRYRIGVALGGGDERVMPTPFGALKSAALYPVEQSQKILQGLYRIISGKEKGEVGGPVAITRVIKEQFHVGWVQVVEVLAILNVYLGLFNLLPLPALDGGRLVFLGYEMVTRRRPNPRFEAAVHTVGFLVLFGLMLVVTFKDIFR